jgi:uncharacterized protein DUF4383
MVRTFALVVGIVFLAVGLLGLILHPNGGLLLNLFAVDLLHNLIHLAVGAAGLAVYLMGWGESRMYSQIVGVAYLLLGLLGFISPLITQGMLLGLIHVNTADNLLHLIVGGIGAYVGFSPEHRRPAIGDRIRGRA